MQVDKTSILDLDMSVGDSSQTEIIAIDVLDYSINPMVDVALLLKKLRYGGTLTLENNNFRGITIDIFNGEIYRGEDIIKLLYNGRKSTTIINELIKFVEDKGFKVSNIIMSNHKYSLTIERPNA